MSADCKFSRIDVIRIRFQIEKTIGQSRTEKYFSLLTRFLSFKVNKREFQRLCIAILGKENVHFHNHLLGSVIRNTCLSNTPPPKDPKEGIVENSVCNKKENEQQIYSSKPIYGVFPRKPRKFRTPIRRHCEFKDRLSPLGSYGKKHNIICEDVVPKGQERQSPTEMHTLGGRPPGLVEDGEEVNQDKGSPSIHGRSPVTAPLGVSINSKGTQMELRKRSASAVYTETCHYNCELPDTNHLKKRLEQRLQTEGLEVSVDCANLLNNSLDVFLKRLIKPCLDQAGSRSGHGQVEQRHIAIPCLKGIWPNSYVGNLKKPVSVSVLDFRVAMELNPWMLGEDWQAQLEKARLFESDYQMASNKVYWKE